MSGWVPIVVSIVLTSISFVVLNRTIRVRTTQQSALDEIRREVGAMITELNQTTERNIELIEDRISQLNRLVGEADRRVRALSRDRVQVDRARDGIGAVGRDTYDELRRHRRVGARDGDPSGGEQADEPREPTDRVAAPLRESSVTDATRETLPGGVPGASPGTEPSLRERVRTLYLQGIPMDRIARIVGTSIGEIELMVSLQEGSN